MLKWVLKDDLKRIANTIREKLNYEEEETLTFPFCEDIQDILNFPINSDWGTVVGYNTNQPLGYISLASITCIVDPQITEILSNKCSYADNLQYINFPEVSIIGEKAFYCCYNLTAINLPNCVTIGSDAFWNVWGLTSLNLPKCKIIYDGCFDQNVHLKTIYLPECEYLYERAIAKCYELTDIYIPKCKIIETKGMWDNYKLTSLTLNNCNSIGEYGLAYCSTLTSIYLLNTNQPTIIANSNVFSGTPILDSSLLSGSYGSIYIPQEMRSAYLALGTNWTISEIWDRIVFI